MHEDVWRRAGFDRTEGQTFPPGVSDDHADELQGHAVLTDNSKWLNFHTVRNEHWHDGNVVLLGDAAHTAHFSIGSGTKLAMEDALALAACLHEHPTLEAALEAYESERKPVVESTQRAAQASMEWFESIGMYADQEPAQFVFTPGCPGIWTDEQVRSAVDAAMLPIVASLGAVGVVSAHWLPDRAGEPVVWVRVKDEASRVAVESYSWVLPQVQIILTRLAVPPEMVMRLRMEVTSAEAEDRLFEADS